MSMNLFSSARYRKFEKPVASFVESPFVVVCIAILVSAWCKISALGSRELWLDETFSAYVANSRFGDLIRQVTGDVHPPLYYMLLWLWVRVTGDAQTQLRMFGVVLSIFSAVAMYVLARKLLGATFGAFATALFAFSPMLFVYSLEVRMYMLSILVLVCLLPVHWKLAVEHSKAIWHVFAYGVLAALLFYVHYIGVFILLGLFVHWALASSFAWRPIARLCAAGLLTLLFIAPGIPVLLEQRAGKADLGNALRLSHRNPSALSFEDSEQSLIKPEGMAAAVKSAAAMAGFYPASSSVLLLLCAVPLGIVLAGVGFLGLVKGDQICLLFIIVMLTIGIGMVTLHSTVTRFMLPLVPLLVLALARTIQYWAALPGRRASSLAIGILILCLYAVGFFRQALIQHGRPWQNLVSAVQWSYQPGDWVIFDAEYSQVPFDYFAEQMHFHPRENGFPVSVYYWWNNQGFKGWGGPVILQSDLDQFVSILSASKQKTVWLVLYETNYYDPQDALLARLRQLGQATEIHLPPDPDTPKSQDKQTLRLVRISLN